MFLFSLFSLNNFKLVSINEFEYCGVICLYVGRLGVRTWCWTLEIGVGNWCWSFVLELRVGASCWSFVLELGVGYWCWS